MASFKFVISDKNRSWQIEKEQKDAPILGKKLGESFTGDFLGLSGYELEITGGSDKEGFPMKRDVEGSGRKKIIISDGFAFHTEKEGERRRRLVRGNTISGDITQVNCKVAKSGDKPLEEVLGKKEESATEA